MKPFEIEPLGKSRVSDVVSRRASIDMSPPYQRQAEIWSTTKQQLFIDSILNGFDVPKLYFHDISAKKFKYAVVDGKQRLGAILAFVDDELPLADDFQILETSDSTMAGVRYSDLTPELQSRFDDYVLPIQVIYASDIEWVEELFSRLNEAVALNAPERRNALGGPLPPIIRRLPQHAFFTNTLPIKNNRYKHYDLATKFLYIEHIDGPGETKRRDLDGFVIDFRDKSQTKRAAELEVATGEVLERLVDVFGESDALLSSVGLVVIYYLLEREKILSSESSPREALADFDELRRQVRALMRADETTGKKNVKLDPDLVEFERLSQSPNDITAMKRRMQTLTAFVRKPSDIKKALRALK